jgi:hypothetical protein
MASHLIDYMVGRTRFASGCHARRNWMICSYHQVQSVVGYLYCGQRASAFALADMDRRVSAQRFASCLNALSASCFRGRLWPLGCEGAAGRDGSSLLVVVIDLDRRRVTAGGTGDWHPVCANKADDAKQTKRTKRTKRTIKAMPDCVTRFIPHHVNRINTKRRIVSMVN